MKGRGPRGRQREKKRRSGGHVSGDDPRCRQRIVGGTRGGTKRDMPFAFLHMGSLFLLFACTDNEMISF